MNEKERIQEAYEKTILNDAVGGPGSYEDEKTIAMKMKAKGYKMVILFPSSMNSSPLYVMDTLSASRLMRNEFKKVKDYKIMKISDFTKQKSNKEEEKTNEAKYSDSAKMDTIGSRGDKAVIFDLNTVTIKDGKTEIRFDINEATQLYRSLKRKLK